MAAVRSNPARDRAESLARELTELCAYRYALEAKFLSLLREFDTDRCWERLGLHSCAHWLNLKCGIGLNAAREKIRVANALAGLPLISKAFSEGRVSYSKVRAMTRVATPENEEYLMMIAKHGTAYHVETLVRLYRRECRLRAAQKKGPNSSRALHYHTDEDGMLVIEARLSPEQGALVLKALDAAVEQQPDVTAETSAPDAQDVTAETPEPISARRADALAEVAEGYLGSDNVPCNSADRHQVVVHVTAETLMDGDASDSDVTAVTPRTVDPLRSGHASTSRDAPPEHQPRVGAQKAPSHIEDGPGVTAETSRRIACDASLVRLVKDQKGEPLSIGRKSRTIPPPMRRALIARDKGCRFPGCTHTRFVDGHHIEHWANGGETSLENLVLLCRHHHRLVHEGGFSCERRFRGNVEFRDPQGTLLTNTPALEPVPRGEDPTAWLKHRFDRLGIDAETCIAKWYAGDTIDWDLAVFHLDEAARLASNRMSP